MVHLNIKFLLLKIFFLKNLCISYFENIPMICFIFVLSNLKTYVNIKCICLFDCQKMKSFCGDKGEKLTGRCNGWKGGSCFCKKVKMRFMKKEEEEEKNGNVKIYLIIKHTINFLS